MEYLALELPEAFGGQAVDALQVVLDVPAGCGAFPRRVGFRLGGDAAWRRVCGNSREVLDDLLGVLGLARTALAGDEEGLIFALVEHIAHSAISHGEDMWRVVLATAALVRGDVCIGVDRKRVVWIDRDEEEAGEGVDEPAEVALAEVVDDTRLVEEGEVGDVVDLVELGGVHGSEVVGGDGARGAVGGEPDEGVRVGRVGRGAVDRGGEIARGRIGDPDVRLRGELGGGRGLREAAAGRVGGVRGQRHRGQRGAGRLAGGGWRRLLASKGVCGGRRKGGRKEPGGRSRARTQGTKA